MAEQSIETTSMEGLTQHRFIDPRTLMSIKHLELRAKVVVEGFWNGLHRSPYHGFSVEFTEYRQYTPGDDPRYLDWKLYARSDRYYIKKFEDETNLRCFLLMDRSKSMEFGSKGFTKQDYANTLAATLGYFLSRQGDAVGLMSFDEVIQEYMPARNRPGHLRQLMQTLEKPCQGESTDIKKPIKRIMDLLKSRGLIVLISDFLAPLDELEDNLATLTAYGHEVQVFHILDPAERHFTFEEAIQFEDQETGQLMYVDPATAKKDYMEQMENHLEKLKNACDKSGIGYTLLTTDQPLEKGLFDFLKARIHRGRVVQRKTHAG
ncbi:DUF58 domain-containing protein [Verrucomicrobia bacterium]|jgi:uncharacterized protein (DUF58 family)|nr:DUF58 domain-containing protein [Verrucomicrobiota bacterium]MDB4718581.1 DUF58 domain-containing protein [Verrucomicrobiota bacterium]